MFGITLGVVALFVVKRIAAYFSEVVLGIIGNRLVAQPYFAHENFGLVGNVLGQLSGLKS
jgi:hypothetical protein